MMISRTTFRIVILTLLLGVFISACGGSTGEVSPIMEVNTEAEISIDGKTLLEERCTACHTLDQVESASKSAAGWGLNVRGHYDPNQTTTVRLLDLDAEWTSSRFFLCI
jgi:hypothetical protein